MRTQKQIKRIVIVGIAGAVLGSGIGLTSLTFADPGSAPGQHNAPAANPSAPGLQKPNYHKNAKGQSFGSELDATTPADLPDLVLAYAENGQLGYVYARDLRPELFGSGPTSPQQALADQATAPKTRVITVYAEDGTTKIGVLVMHKQDS